MLGRIRTLGVLAVAVSVVGCSDDSVGPGDGNPALVDLEPQSGQVDVDVGTVPTLWFDHPLTAGMEAYAALHRGSLSGPVVDGSWSMTPDRTALRFQPTPRLDPATLYTLHVGAGMVDGSGKHVSLAIRGPGLGGGWVTASMMTGAMGVGGPAGTMMGAGWAHPTNGTFGMAFTFTTAR